MFGVCHYSEVLDSVIKFVLVDMVDVLFTGKRATKELLNNNAMFWSVLPVLEKIDVFSYSTFFPCWRPTFSA